MKAFAQWEIDQQGEAKIHSPRRLHQFALFRLSSIPTSVLLSKVVLAIFFWLAALPWLLLLDSFCTSVDHSYSGRGSVAAKLQSFDDSFSDPEIEAGLEFIETELAFQIEFHLLFLSIR